MLINPHCQAPAEFRLLILRPRSFDNPVVLIGRAIGMQWKLRIDTLFTKLRDEDSLCDTQGGLLVGHITAVLLGSLSCGNERTNQKQNGNRYSEHSEKSSWIRRFGF